MALPRLLILSLRLAFWGALVFAVTMALLPHPPRMPIDDWGDKAEHALAFTTLAIFGAAAYPAMPLRLLGERLSFLGALIEVMQSIPALHRDCDVFDWLTDTAAVIVALALVPAARALIHGQVRRSRADAPPCVAGRG